MCRSHPFANLTGGVVVAQATGGEDPPRRARVVVTTCPPRKDVDIDPSKYDILLVGPRISRLKPFFTQRGYRADAIGGGQEGLEALNAKLYHLVVLELDLEDIEPVDFLEYAIRCQPNAAYMLMDDPAKSGMIVSTFVRGIDVYVPIPPDEEALFIQVGRHVMAAAARGGGRSEADHYEAELKNARTSLETAGAQVRRLRDENEQLQGELSVARASLDEADAKHLADMRSLREDLANARKELEQLRSTTGPLQRELDELREKGDMLTILEAENEDLKSRLTRALQRPAGPAPTVTPTPLPTTAPLSIAAVARPSSPVAPSGPSPALTLGMDEAVSFIEDDESTGIVDDDEGILLSEDDDGEIILDDEGTLNIEAPGESAANIAAALVDDDEHSTMVRAGISPASQQSVSISDLVDEEENATLVKAGISAASLDEASILLGDEESRESTTTGVTAPAARIGIDDLLGGGSGFSDEQTMSIPPRIETRDHPVRVAPSPPLGAPPVRGIEEETRVGLDSPAAGPFSIPLGMEGMISELVDESTRDIPIPDEIQALGDALAEFEEEKDHDEHLGEGLDEFDLGSLEGPSTVGPAAADGDDEATRNIPLPDPALLAASRGDVKPAGVAGRRPEAPLALDDEFGDATAALALPNFGPPVAQDVGGEEETAANAVPQALLKAEPNDLFDDSEFPITAGSDDGSAEIGLDDPLTSAVPVPSHGEIKAIASATVMRQRPLAPPPPTKPLRAPRGLTLGEQDDDDVRPKVRDEKSLKRAASGGRPTDIDLDIDFDD